MLLDDAVSDGETKAGAAADSLRGEKRIVNFRDVFGSNADAIVGDFDGQRVLVSVFGRQHDTAVAVRDRIAGIQDQVREDLLQFYWIAVNLRRMIAILANDFDLAAA